MNGTNVLPYGAKLKMYLLDSQHIYVFSVSLQIIAIRKLNNVVSTIYLESHFLEFPMI